MDTTINYEIVMDLEIAETRKINYRKEEIKRAKLKHEEKRLTRKLEYVNR